MSQSYYVNMKLKEAPEDEKATAVVVRRNPQRCSHVATICSVCFEQWATDYKINLDSTQAGRDLKGLVTAISGQEPPPTQAPYDTKMYRTDED